MADVKDTMKVLRELAGWVIEDRPRSDAARMWRDRVAAALAELERRARVERRRDQCLQDDGAFEIRHWDDALGWAVLIFQPSTADGELPPPSFDEFEDRAHDQDYWVACDAALDAYGVPKESE